MEEKKLIWYDSEFFLYNLMLNTGKKIRALHDKKINILPLVLSEKKNISERKKKPIAPSPLQVKWSVPYNPQSQNTCV